MSKITRFLLYGFLGAAFFLLCSYVYLVQSRVAGYELNSQTWQIRHFEFYADPFTNTELIGVDRSGKVRWTIDPAITGQLGSTGVGRWDLIEMDDYRTETSVGPAAILVDSLTSRRSGWGSTAVEYWPEWTRKNPKVAGPFWKSVQSLTMHGAYNDIPTLLEVAVSNTSAIPELSNRVTAQALLRRATQLQTSGDIVDAKAAATEGLVYDPNSGELKKIASGN